MEALSTLLALYGFLLSGELSTGHRWISPTKCMWCVALVISLLLTRTRCWTNSQVTGVMRRSCEIPLMYAIVSCSCFFSSEITTRNGSQILWIWSMIITDNLPLQLQRVLEMTPTWSKRPTNMPSCSKTGSDSVGPCILHLNTNMLSYHYRNYQGRI